MNKSDLIDAMAADAGISKAAAKAALESVTSNVNSSLLAKLSGLMLNINIKKIIIILFFINLYYRSKINYC